MTMAAGVGCAVAAPVAAAVAVIAGVDVGDEDAAVAVAVGLCVPVLPLLPQAANARMHGMVTTPRPSLWGNADFLKLWAGQSISQVGSQVSLLAIPLTAVVTLHATAFQAGLLGTFEFLPFLLVGLPAGVWVDRLARRPILVAADVGRAIALSSIPITAGLHQLRMPQLYAVSLVTGVLTVFFDVAYQSYLPSLVEREQLVDGNGKLELTRSTAEIAGPGLGGFLVGVLTAPIAVAADAGSYVASVVSLLLIRRPEHVEPRVRGSRLRTELAEGVRYVWGHPLLRPIAMCTGISNFFSHIGVAVVILYAVRNLGLSAGLIGLWYSVGSLGGPLGAATARRVARRFGAGRTIVGMASTVFLSWAIVPAAPRASPLPFLILSGLIGSYGVIYNITQVSLRQAITPQRLQGRMNATMRFLVWGTIPLGAFTGGVIGSTLGLRTALWIAAGGQLLAVLPPLLSPVVRLRSIEDAVREYVPATPAAASVP
jgi:MFS family permease